MNSSQNEDCLPNDNCHEASEQMAAERQQELIEKLLKNVAVASEVTTNTVYVCGCQIKQQQQQQHSIYFRHMVHRTKRKETLRSLMN